MKEALVKRSPVDFEEFGYEVMLHCNDLQQAKDTCSLHLQVFEDELQPELHRRNSEVTEAKSSASALHSQLYDRPAPVNDAQMFSHRTKIRIWLALAVLAGVACLVGNMTTFYLLGFGPLLTFFSGAGLTVLPLVVGHMAYEWIVSQSRWMHVLVVLLAVLLTAGGILLIGNSRGQMVDRATSVSTTHSYVDGEAEGSSPPVQEPESTENSESGIHRTLGHGMFLIMLAADLALAFLVGLLIRMSTDDDYARWRKLEELKEQILALEERVRELIALPEIAKKLCLAGILRAQNARSRRPPPYHRALTIALIGLVMFARPLRAQTVERYEAILIDASGSISRHGKSNELFHAYLIATRKLLLQEPPSSRVWVFTIATDSFGGTHEVLKGWTPEAHGVFTDDVNRARRQLALSFEAKSSGMSAMASGTDIFGALWRLKAVFESGDDGSWSVSKEIWIMSDMMNETKELPMPQLFDLGPEAMLEDAKAEGLLVPLKGYTVHVCGASTAGVTAKQWMTIRKFWTDYFAAAGAELVSYLADADVERRTP